MQLLANNSTSVINKIGFGTSDVPLPTLNNGFRPLLGAVSETYNSVLGSTYEVGLGYCLSMNVSTVVGIAFSGTLKLLSIVICYNEGVEGPSMGFGPEVATHTPALQVWCLTGVPKYFDLGMLQTQVILGGALIKL